MKFEYLNQLADIVVSIDEGKNITDANVVSMTDQAIRLIAKMKLLGLDVGALHEIFVGMQLKCGDRVMLTELIEVAHEELVSLLGPDAWRVYGCDDGGWFYQQDDFREKVAALSIAA
ncbi:hypothetical protein [Methylotenera sp. G11]|uniref:hypothetical protein n=1 Tax=Methylotenera sp. G11 TaxID=1506585 RepID=UPI00064557DC|nr:hypothetical protein [Methylotenera sp. G11]